MSSYYQRKRFNLAKFLRFLFSIILGIVCIHGYRVWRANGLPVTMLPYQGGPSLEDEMLSEPSEAQFALDDVLAQQLDESAANQELSKPQDIEPPVPDAMTSAAPQLSAKLNEPADSEDASLVLAAVESSETDGAVVSAELSAASSSGEAAEPEPLSLVVTHTVSTGETLWDIARKYNVTMDTIIVANQLTNIHRLRVGQVLQVPTRDGVLYTVRSGDSLWTISRRFKVNADAIAQENNLSDPSRLRLGQELFIPGMAAVEASRYQLVGPDGQLRAAFLRPVSGGWISSRFGQRWGRLHAGVDIAVPTGTPVRAAADGVVKFAGNNGGYGLLVTIDHGENVETRYAHNSRIVVKKGQRVKAGQVIAYSGNTGNSTGPHLHFEIRLNGKPYDPLKYIR